MWLRFLEEIKPESVILDYAHTAQLAVYVSQLPAVQISNGFDVPPPHCPIFAINARGPYLEATNRVKVQEIARALEALGNNLKCQRSLNLAEYLEYPFKIWDCIPETDPYGPRSKGLVVGPLGEPPKVSDAAWPLDLDTSKRKVFGYLRGMLGNEELLDALLLHQCSGIVVWPDAPPAALEKFARTEVRVLNTPVDLSHLLPTADFVVSYGAVALVTRTLLAGKPQLVATADAEKYLIARKVALLGAGVVWRPSIGTASKAVEHLLSSERFVLAAQSLANRYARSEWLTQQCQSLQVHLVEPRIIEYLLSQVQRAGNESLREK
jgi:UDP:flavonoid glycosyltransferase YjiC (YdhE family)